MPNVNMDGKPIPQELARLREVVAFYVEYAFFY